jgi:hypothetical protein
MWLANGAELLSGSTKPPSEVITGLQAVASTSLKQVKA